MNKAMNFWDQQFSEEGYKYGTAPNTFLQSEAHRIAPCSKVLVPGDGEGRNRGRLRKRKIKHVKPIADSRY